MARPEEKAQAMLNKWTKMKEQGENYNEIQSVQKRPYLASMCDHLYDAEKFRRQILREIESKVSKIQNAGLGEHLIRDLNDEINKLIREKWHWNKRILELKGPNYNSIEKREQLEAGDDQTSLGLQGSGGYRYFGAAKNLPGVKELFSGHTEKMTKRRRGDIYKHITADYYGIRDDDDGVLLELEENISKKNRNHVKVLRKKYFTEFIGKNHHDQASEDELEECSGIQASDDAGKSVHDKVSIQEIVKKIMLEKQKKDFLKSISL